MNKQFGRRWTFFVNAWSVFGFVLLVVALLHHAATPFDVPHRKALLNDYSNDEETNAIEERSRRGCVQASLLKAAGYKEHPGQWYHAGCRYPPQIMSFERWVSSTHCEIAHSQSPLILHTSWDGREEAQLVRFIKAFFLTQGPMTRLLVWELGSNANTTRHQPNFALQTGGDRVEFRSASTERATLAAGTCLSSTPPTSTGWPGHPDPRGELFRIVALSALGGVWLDVSFLPTRDLSPLIDFVGEFVGAHVMRDSLSTSILGMRPKSWAAREMLELLCDFPKDDINRSVWGRFCDECGQPCPLQTWYGGLPAQYVQRSHPGLLVAVPMSWFDPVGECPLIGLNALQDDDLDQLRGSFAVKIDAEALNNIPLLRRLNDSKIGPLVPTSQEMLDDSRKIRRIGGRTDPVFEPKGRQLRVMAESIRSIGNCLVFDARGGRFTRQKLMTEIRCDQMREWREAKGVWIWHPDSGGYLRPAFQGVGFVACIDASPGVGNEPIIAQCDENSSSQRWVLKADSNISNLGLNRRYDLSWEAKVSRLGTVARSSIRNAALGVCLSAVNLNGVRKCGSGFKDNKCRGVTLVRCTTTDAHEWRVSWPGYVGAGSLRPQSSREIELTPF